MSDAGDGYVHGYSEREAERLRDQAATLGRLLHEDTVFAPGAAVIEVGCGVGAQTAIVAPQSPTARLISMDVAAASLREARRRAAAAGVHNVRFVQADLFRMPFGDACFDQAFVCFVLEHVPDPQGALHRVRRLLKPGGRLTVIEGDHGSAYFHPWSEEAWRTIAGLVEAQARAGGDALIGRRLYPLLSAAGFREVVVRPRVVYADASRPEWVEGFTRRTFIAMVEGARQRALDLGLLSAADWERGIAALKKTAEADGTFNYTFFKATAVR